MYCTCGEKWCDARNQCSGAVGPGARGHGKVLGGGVWPEGLESLLRNAQPPIRVDNWPRSMSARYVNRMASDPIRWR